jgi:hypothetical protein
MSKTEKDINLNTSLLVLEAMNNTLNGTSLSTSTSTPILKQIHDILIVVLLVWVMFSMGCSITLKQVRKSIVVSN